MSVVVDRIFQFIDYKEINKTNFYKETGLSNGFLDKVKDVGSSKLELILNRYPEINPEWLIMGNGGMLKNEREGPATLNEIEDSNSEGIPLIPIDAMAGFGTGSIQLMDYETSTYIIPEFHELKVDFMIRVKGKSMEPAYNNGDLVACRKLHLSDIFFQWNKVYVLDTEQGAIIKRVKKGKDQDHILLISDNIEYDPFDLHLSKINSIGLVVGAIRLY